ncbi:unnamed protein product, partial [Bubo scandiacus]
MSHSQFHCTARVYLDMHGLSFETSICYWQDQPGSRHPRRTRGRPARRRALPTLTAPALAPLRPAGEAAAAGAPGGRRRRRAEGGAGGARRSWGDPREGPGARPESPPRARPGGRRAAPRGGKARSPQRAAADAAAQRGRPARRDPTAGNRHRPGERAPRSPAGVPP